MKNIKINLMKMILVLILAVSLTAVGTADIDNQPDSDSPDQRLPSVVALHGVMLSPKGNRSRKGNSKPAVTPEQFKTKMQVGTKFQHKAWKKLGLERPFYAAKNMVVTMCTLHKLGRGTIADLFNKEVRNIVLSAAIIKDPAYRLDYVLHCINNLGSAISAVKREKAHKDLDFSAMTITPDMIESSVLSAFKDEESQYKLSVDDHMVTQGKTEFAGLTNTLNRLLVRDSNSALRLAAKQAVLETADEDYKQFVGTQVDEEAAKVAATETINAWVGEYEDNGYKTPKSWKVTLTHDKPLPTPVPPIYLQNTLVELGTSIKLSKRGNVDAETTKDIVNGRAELITALVSKNRQHIQSKDDFVQDQIKAKTTELSKLVQPSRVITMRRGNDLTCQWHLTHMSDWKRNSKKGKVFAVKNTHSGARFLLGPSNGVRVPNNVLGDSSKEGSRSLTGDAVSMQMILCAHLKGSMNPKSAQANSEMYFMMQMALDSNPDNSSRVVGLYTHPDVVADPNHDAPALAKLVAKVPMLLVSKPKKGNRKRQGPNAQKNANVRKANEKNESNEFKPSKDELAKYAPSKETTDNGLTEQLDKALSGEPNDPYGTMTKGELQQVCRNKKIANFSKLAKKPLLDLIRVNEHTGGDFDISSITPQPVQVKPTAPKGRKAPDAARKRNHD